MSTSTPVSSSTTTGTITTLEGRTSTPEQLRLLDTADLPLQFRLDIVTRQRGLAHVAELRRLLAQRTSPWAA